MVAGAGAWARVPRERPHRAASLCDPPSSPERKSSGPIVGLPALYKCFSFTLYRKFSKRKGGEEKSPVTPLPYHFVSSLPVIFQMYILHFFFSCLALYWALYTYRLLESLQQSFWLGISRPHFTEEKADWRLSGLPRMFTCRCWDSNPGLVTPGPPLCALAQWFSDAT